MASYTKKADMSGDPQKSNAPKNSPNPGRMNPHQGGQEFGSTYDVIQKEMGSQDEAIHASDTGTRKVYGPAAGHYGGNPTASGGINRPTKGQM